MTGLASISAALWYHSKVSRPNLGRAISPDALTSEPLSSPVLKPIAGGRQATDEEATNDLHVLRAKAAVALAGEKPGYVRREALVAGGLTVEDCSLARKLEWGRKIEGLMRPGMPLESRREAARRGAVNASLPRFAAFWTVLADLLAGEQEATGQAEIEIRETAEGSQRMVVLNTRRDIAESLRTLPILLLDATMPAELVRHYLPRLEMLAEVRVQAPHMHVHQITGGFGKTTLVPSDKLPEATNRTRRNKVAEIRDFVAGITRGRPSLMVTYQAIEGEFAQVPGVEVAHFNDVAGHDRWSGVEHLFVLGRPLPKPEDIRLAAAALSGRPVGVGQPHRETRGVRLADGTGAAIEVRAYEDPLAEAVRAAITDAEVVQAIGRARGINREAHNPVQVWLMADVVTPLVVERVSDWNRLAPGQVERMACRGVLFTSAVDAAAMCADLFPTRKAAERALDRAKAEGLTSSPPPYEELLIGERGRNRLLRVRYRPIGRGQQTRLALARADSLPDLRERLTEALGPLSEFKVEGHPEPPDQPRPPSGPPARPVSEPSAAHLEVAMPHAADPPSLASPGIAKPSNPQAALAVLRSRLEAATASLEACRPPRLWGDEIDTVRVLAWRERCTANREKTERLLAVLAGALPRGGGGVELRPLREP